VVPFTGAPAAALAGWAVLLLGGGLALLLAARRRPVGRHHR
jgi:hypothetical protein